MDFAELYAPFPPEAVSWRVGPTNREKTKGMALAYIDARDVMNRLDAVCGAQNWQTDYPWGDGKRVVCRIGIRIDGEWVWKGDGAGDTDTEGEKGALSDAFKRAAVKWGIGRYLYDIDSPWVEIEARGNSYFIPDRELSRLRSILAGKKAPAPKAAPMPEPSKGEPGKPITHALKPEFLRDFWNRPSYTVTIQSDRSGPQWVAWFDWMWQLADAAPGLDAILKLQDDNKANLAGFLLAAKAEHRKLMDHFAQIERVHGKAAA